MPEPLHLEPRGEDQLVLVRHFAAAPERVFRAFTEPEALLRWMGTEDWPLVRAEVDLRVGGQVRYEWAGDRGVMGLTGTYERIDPPHLLEHTEVFDDDWTDGPAHVSTRFEAVDTGTRVTMTLTYSSAATRQRVMTTGMARGMELNYLNLDDLLAERLHLFRIDPERDLVLDRVVPVPPSRVWQAWTDPEQLVRWFTPAPWGTASAAIDAFPGGRFDVTMRSPEGELHPNQGCVLVAVRNRLLVWTDALQVGFRPAPQAFFTGILRLTPHPQGTRYVAIARHGSAATCREHAEMGFLHGWGAALDQLVDLVGPGTGSA